MSAVCFIWPALFYKLSMEQKIISHLVDKYDPSGIIVTGSRATDEYLSDSDWDLLVFTDVEESEVEDFADYRGYHGAALDVAPYPRDVDSDFVIWEGTHPAEHMRILYEETDGEMQRIVDNTRQAYERGPEPLTGRQHDLYSKMLTRYIRKVRSRGDQQAVVFFAASQFFLLALRYWFEQNSMWPRAVHEAMSVIREKDPAFADELKVLYTESSVEVLRNAMERIHDALYESMSL